MLTRVNTWPAFSNHSPSEGSALANSLEVIHDNIHSQVGGEGHMGDPAVAGIVLLAFSFLPGPERSFTIRL